MIIIGADYHPAFQQIAFVDSETGEWKELRLGHREEAEEFYRDLASQGMRVRVGMEASGPTRWIARMHSCCCDCPWKIAFHGSGWRAGRIATCGNCCGTGTGWCRRARV
jgi:hypothetical protein